MNIYGYHFSAGKTSDGVMDSNKKDDNKTNKKDKSVFNKSGGK